VVQLAQALEREPRRGQQHERRDDARRQHVQERRREHDPREHEVAELAIEVIGLGDQRDRRADREREQRAGALERRHAARLSEERIARDRLGDDQLAQAHRGAHRPRELIPVVSEEQDDPRADQAAAEQRQDELARSGPVAQGIQLVMLGEALGSGWVEDLVLHEARELILEPSAGGTGGVHSLSMPI
jgi:hypothetical protein